MLDTLYSTCMYIHILAHALVVVVYIHISIATNLPVCLFGWGAQNIHMPNIYVCLGASPIPLPRHIRTRPNKANAVGFL